ncbi:MAG: excinuclease ATPase subunit, partial [Lysobacteraceae bacterium]
MRRPTLVLSTLLMALAIAPVADARDTRQHFDIATALAAGKADGTLDGSVRFYFKGAATPSAQRLGPATTNKKTNAVGKGDATACQWAMLGALKALQE